MKTMTVTEFSRNLKSVFDRIEYQGEEIVLIRNQHPIARIVPGGMHMNALEAMGDLYQTLPEDAASHWLEDSRMPDRLNALN